MAKTKAQPPVIGRPTDYNEDIGLTICTLLIEGMSLRSITSMDGMPDKATVLRWVARYPIFRDHYTRAREAQTEAMAHEILEIADEISADPQRSRLQVDARKWLMSKMAPKKYGDKVVIDAPPAPGDEARLINGEAVLPPLMAPFRRSEVN